MSEITREEVRAWLEDCASTMEAVAQLPWLKTPVPAMEASMFRLALAALEDAERVEWYEGQHTLHGAVECLYVVDGYHVSVTHDGDTVAQYHGDSVRSAFDRARGK